MQFRYNKKYFRIPEVLFGDVLPIIEDETGDFASLATSQPYHELIVGWDSRG